MIRSHLQEQLDALRTALASLPEDDPSTTAWYSDIVLTHIIFTVLSGDDKRAGWRRLHGMPRRSGSKLCGSGVSSALRTPQRCRPSSTACAGS